MSGLMGVILLVVPAPEEAFRDAVWGTVEENGDAGLELCRAFMPVPGKLQTVQRAAILALQAFWPGHSGIDNLNAVRSVGRLLDHGCLSNPLPLVKDGDLVAIIQHLIRVRGLDTFKGHATEADVEQGRVREDDEVGNAEADTAADLGGWHQSEAVWDAKRALLNARERWFPIMLQLHRFMVAVSRVSVNHDERCGSALDPLVWDQEGRHKQRKVDIRVHVDRATLPGPPGFLLRFMESVLLVLMLLLGPTVLVCYVSWLRSLVPCIGLLILGIWVI